MSAFATRGASMNSPIMHDKSPIIILLLLVPFFPFFFRLMPTSLPLFLLACFNRLLILTSFVSFRLLLLLSLKLLLSPPSPFKSEIERRLLMIMKFSNGNRTHTRNANCANRFRQFIMHPLRVEQTLHDFQFKCWSELNNDWKSVEWTNEEVNKFKFWEWGNEMNFIMPNICAIYFL